MDSLLAQDMSGMTWEAIVADGMSDDGTREILQEYGARHPECAPSTIRGAWYRRA
jgi:glycosyltransferase involved in cell wall biosynthesis